MNNNNKWSKVKIKGNIIAENGVSLEGFIGLEVLKQYEPSLLNSDKKIKKVERNEDTLKKANHKKRLKNNKPISLSGSNDKQLLNENKNLEALHVTRKRLRNDSSKQKKRIKFPKNDRFKLLRPPPLDTESDNDNGNINENELNETSTLPFQHDMEAWNGLGIPVEILKALAEQGFKSPTEIQILTLPAAIMGKKDILGAAETGSGKTLAFGIPLLAGILELKKRNIHSGIRKPLHRVANTVIHNNELRDEFIQENELSDDNETDNEYNYKPLYAIILTPTRELAVQVRDHLIAAAVYTDIKIIAIFGGLSADKQERLLKKRPEIVVATPGRFWDLYQQGQTHLNKLEDISFLVIDETDRMVEKGHFEELRNILKVLNHNESKKQCRQNFIFSATLTLVHDLPEHMQKKNFGKRPRFTKPTPEMKIGQLIEDVGISQPKIIDITPKQQMAQNITECRLLCPLEHKDYYLYYFVQYYPGRTIVFCNSIDCVKRLATLFSILQCQPLPLHANMAQKQRLKNLDKFRVNPNGLLIATDVAARGLDIPNVEHVIHYQVPRTSENYVHRSGRTARANKQGLTVIFMEPEEIKNYVKLYKTLQKTADLPLFPINEDYMTEVRQRVNVARAVDREELKLKRSQTEIGWMKKQAENMDIIIDALNNDSDNDDDYEDSFAIERKRSHLRLLNIRKELKTLLNKPIFPKNFSFKYPTLNQQLDVNAKNMLCKDSSAVKVLQQSVVNMKDAKRLKNTRPKKT